ncbi:hypothetical protein C7964_1016 [Loktanella sp. PT4BL]|jgi:hypothetical protein|nr:hypothetical protein C7964_1016 [Loktanella sp. PT4BL]
MLNKKDYFERQVHRWLTKEPNRFQVLYIQAMSVGDRLKLPRFTWLNRLYWFVNTCLAVSPVFVLYVAYEKVTFSQA